MREDDTPLSERPADLSRAAPLGRGAPRPAPPATVAGAAYDAWLPDAAEPIVWPDPSPFTAWWERGDAR
ncbi:hypothetical protein MPY17_39655 (plasmid) [Rhodococcus opacus]|uniref:hypothetical protein n=1 Tax=Rhodococcus opacus TaxID=37919 RepID=UPI001FF25BC3|nr:hypothetical protein [Rhodococcus opacus]UOT08513.1 hypothetical protein MPY17_39655 [Rhodococcus opacus]